MKVKILMCAIFELNLEDIQVRKDYTVLDAIFVYRNIFNLYIFQNDSPILRVQGLIFLSNIP